MAEREGLFQPAAKDGRQTAILALMPSGRRIYGFGASTSVFRPCRPFSAVGHRHATQNDTRIGAVEDGSPSSSTRFVPARARSWYFPCTP